MKILHLYHDLMNLYGEYANVAALQRLLEINHEPCEIDRLSVGDCVKFMDYDFVYVGSGTERNQKYILEHLKPYKEELQSYIETGKMLLMTGNSFEILGHSITDAKGKEYEGLNLFDFTITEQDKTRDTADAVFFMEGEEKLLVGFINKCSSIRGIENPLFQVRMGLGNEPKGITEGICYKNFMGTHLTGPLLIKNPYFLISVGEKLCGRKLEGDYLSYEKAGYDITLRELSKRMENG